MSRIVNDLMDISEFAHHGPEDLFISLVTVVGAFIILCTVNIPLTLITFAVLPFLVLFIIKKRSAMTMAFRKNRIEIAEVNASLENSIAGIRVSRAFTGEREEEKKFAENNQRYVTVRERSYRVMAEFFSGTNFLTSLMNVVTWRRAATASTAASSTSATWWPTCCLSTCSSTPSKSSSSLSRCSRTPSPATSASRS